MNKKLMDFSSTSVPSSTSNQCISTSFISRNVVIFYASIYGLLLLIVSIYSYKSLNEDPEFNKQSYFKQFKKWMADLKKRRSCYIPIIAHIFDQLTDIAVSIQFYEIATDETKYENDWAACNGLNIWYLFILTIMTLIIYRLITGYLIYIYTNRSLTRLLSQILDIELFRSLYINYLCGKSEPCDPQRWITAMEAALESTPQSLIQLVYLVRTGAFDVTNALIIISLFSSLWCIISKLIADDKAMVYRPAKYLNIKMKLHSFFDFIIGIFTILIAIPVIIGSFCCVSVYYIFVDRLTDYSSDASMDRYNHNMKLEIRMRVKNEPDTIMNIEQIYGKLITVIHPISRRKYVINTQNYSRKRWLIIYNDYDRYINRESKLQVTRINEEKAIMGIETQNGRDVTMIHPISRREYKLNLDTYNKKQWSIAFKKEIKVIMTEDRIKMSGTSNDGTNINITNPKIRKEKYTLNLASYDKEKWQISVKETEVVEKITQISDQDRKPMVITASIRERLIEAHHPDDEEKTYTIDLMKYDELEWKIDFKTNYEVEVTQIVKEIEMRVFSEQRNYIEVISPKTKENYIIGLDKYDKQKWKISYKEVLEVTIYEQKTAMMIAKKGTNEVIVVHPETEREYKINLREYNRKEWVITTENKQFFSAIFVDQWYCPRSFSWFYLWRVIWRILDVTSRLFIMILTWLVIGGWSLTFIIILECIMILIICVKTKHWELIIGIVATVVSLTEVTKPISMLIFIYRAISNQIIMILISVWLFVKFECPKCTDYIYREELAKFTSNIFGIFIYCWISAILSPFIFMMLCRFKVFIDGKSTSRALNQMVASRNWDGILEIQLYADQYGIYDKENQKILFELAMDERREAIISYLLHKKDDSILPYNLFDIYIKNPNTFTPKNATEILALYPEIIDKTDTAGNNALDAYSKDPRFVHCSVLQSIYEQSPKLTDKKGRNGLDLLDDLIQRYSKDSLLLTLGDLLYIEEKQPQLVNKLFCSAIAVENGKYVQHAVSHCINSLSITSTRLLLEWYLQNQSFLTTENLIKINEQFPELVNFSFLYAVAANDTEYYSKVIDRMKEKVLSFRDSKNQGLYHYVSMRGGDILANFAQIANQINRDKNDEDIQYKTETDARFLHYQSDFDENGVFYHLGTKYGSQTYENPADAGMVKLKDRSGFNEKIINTVVGRGEAHYFDRGTKSDPPYVTIWIPVSLKLSHYTLRHTYCPLRYWELQGSTDGVKWITLSKHTKDYSIPGSSGSHTWKVNATLYFQHFRLMMVDQESSGKMMLTCSGIELYGISGGFDPVSFYKKYPFCLDDNGKSVFFQFALLGDSDGVQKLIKAYPKLLDRRDENNATILDYYDKNNVLLNDEMLQYIHQKRPQLMNIKKVDTNREEVERKQENESTNSVQHIEEIENINRENMEVKQEEVDGNNIVIYTMHKNNGVIEEEAEIIYDESIGS